MRGATEARVYCPHAVDVKALRRRIDLTQEQFAVRFGFPVATCGIGSGAIAAPRAGPGAAQCHRE